MLRFAFGIAVACLGSAASAQDMNHVFFPEGRDTCLVAGSLAASKSEAVELALVRTAGPDPLSEEAAWDRFRRFKGLPPDVRYAGVRAMVGFRGEAGPRLASLGCVPRERGGVLCAVDCDGGSVSLSETGDGVALRNDGLTLGGTCGAPGRRRWQAGPHDRDFRLARIEGSACLRVAARMRPVFAMEGAPVMDRIAAGRSCFARAYADDHLRTHPRQAVREIRLDWAGFGPGDDVSGQALVTVQLRSGRAASELLRCQVEGFGIQCFPARGSGELALTRAGRTAVQVSLKGSEDGPLARIGGLDLGADDTVFRLQETDCPAP